MVSQCNFATLSAGTQPFSANNHRAKLLTMNNLSEKLVEVVAIVALD